MNFRCSPAFKKLVAGLAKHMAAEAGHQVSIADVMEAAVTVLAKRKGYAGPSDAS